MNRKTITGAVASACERCSRALFPSMDNRAQMGLGGIAQNIQGALGNATGGGGGGMRSSEQRRGVPSASVQEGVAYSTVEEGDFDNTFGDNLTAGVWVDLAEFVVGAQNAYNVGWGMAEFPDVVGRWFQALSDTNGNAVEGVARIKTRNSNDERVETEVRGIPTTRLDTDVSDYRKQQTLPENRSTAKVGEDSKIVLQFKLKSSSTGTSVDFAHADTNIVVPVSNYS